MRNNRKIMLAIVSAVMLILLAVPASAEEDDIENLALGRTVTNISYTGQKGTVLGADTGVDQYGQKVTDESQTEYRLTDGDFGSGLCYDGEHAGFYRNAGRAVSVYFDETDTIKEINIRLLEDEDWGIWLPSEVNFSVSDDAGQTWKYIGNMKKSEVTDIVVNENVPDLFNPGNPGRTTRYYKFEMKGLNYQANAVKVDFDVPVFVFADEFQILGKRGIADGAALAPDNSFCPFVPVDAFPAPGSEQVRGVHDDYLSYVGWADGVHYVKTRTELLPALAYMDTQGTPTDWMFDSFSFLFYTQSSQNRDMTFLSEHKGDQSKAGNMEDWQEYIDLLFNTPDEQLDALDKTVEEVKNVLNDPDYKVHVKIAIPDPVPYQNSFGEVNGRNLNFNPEGRSEREALADRAEAIKWYVDTVLAAWESKNYSNIVLDGFYWYGEEIFNGQESESQTDLVKSASDYIHSRDKIIYWIPFNQAAGFHRWQQFGFDFAVMQPNLPFGSYPTDQPTITAEIAKIFGMGVEMEIHWLGLTQDKYRDMYLEYLNQGITAGYMEDSYQAWYLGTDSLQQMYYSQSPADRELYDYTYQFIKGTYTRKLLSTEVRDLALNKPVTRVITQPDGNSMPQQREVEQLGLLVDGDLGSGVWNDGRHVGFLNGGGREITVDLQGVQTVKSLDMVFANNNKSGKPKGNDCEEMLPQKVQFLLSNDGGDTWVKVGEVERSAALQIDQGYKYEVSGLNYTAGLVRADFDVPCGWVYAGEFEIMGKPGIKDGASEPNPYDDLALNKPISHVIFDPDPNSGPQQQEASKLPLLIDGNLAGGGWSNDDHVGFLWGGGRAITIDLQGTDTIKMMDMIVAQDVGSGVNLPQDVRFYLSNDGGTTWAYVGKADADAVQPYGSEFKYLLKGLNYTANAVKVEFDVTNGWVFASEIQVFGLTGVQDGAIAPPVNIALGKTVVNTLVSGVKGGPYASDGNLYEDDTMPRLTDGEEGTGWPWDHKHAVFGTGAAGSVTGGRSLTVSLKMQSKINQINFDMLEISGWDILASDEVVFYLSDDGGDTWIEAGRVARSQASVRSGTIPDVGTDYAYYNYRIEGLDASADMLKIDFSGPGRYVFADEIQAIGKEVTD